RVAKLKTRTWSATRFERDEPGCRSQRRCTLDRGGAHSTSLRVSNQDSNETSSWLVTSFKSETARARTSARRSTRVATLKTRTWSRTRFGGRSNVDDLLALR